MKLKGHRGTPTTASHSPERGAVVGVPVRGRLQGAPLKASVPRGPCCPPPNEHSRFQDFKVELLSRYQDFKVDLFFKILGFQDLLVQRGIVKI